MAKSCRNLKILQLLLDIGADVIGKNKSFPTLHNFADAQNIEGIKFILDHGFDINYKNENGQTALDRAMQGSKPETVEFLLQNGAKKGNEI